MSMREQGMICLFIVITMLLFVPSFVLAEGEGTSKASSASKLIAITFDDGPGPYTGKLLDALAARNAKATFFVVGNRVHSYSALVAREAKEGHQIGNHSWDHSKLTALGGNSLAAQLNQTASAIGNITGGSGFYLRPPYGSYNNTVKSYAGVPLILWSVDTLDWKYRNATTVKNNIVNGAKDGAIILLHDIHSTSVDGAIAAMDILQSQGYELVTVSELMRRRGVTPVPGQVYSSVANTGVNLPGNDTEDSGKDFDESRLPSHWAYSSIEFVKSRGIFYGLSETVFGPDKYMTRGMFVTVLSRLSGETITGYANPFTDVKAEDYYSDAVAWAKNKKLVSGMTETTFAANSFMTREQMCALMQRYAEYKGVTLEKKNSPVIFSDNEKISSYAKSAVSELQQSGLISGMGDGSFAPKGKSTRAQVATVCHFYVATYVDGTPMH